MDIKESQQNYAVDDIFADRSPNTGYIIYMASVIGCALVLYTFATVFKNPSFALGVDRFDYANMFDYGSIYGKALRLIKYLLVLCIVLAIYKNNKIGWLALVVYCMHSLWTGNKFGSIFSLLCTFLMIYSQKIETRIEQLKKMIILVMATLIVLIGVAVFAASFTRDEGAYGYLLPRVAQQSQLWWKTYDKSRHYHMHEFRDEIKYDKDRNCRQYRIPESRSQHRKPVQELWDFGYCRHIHAHYVQIVLSLGGHHENCSNLSAF